LLASFSSDVSWLIAGQALRRPKAEAEYPAAASSPTLDDSLNLRSAHPVKVVGHSNLSRHESQAPTLIARWSIECGYLGDGFTCFRDDERLTGSCFFDKL